MQRGAGGVADRASVTYQAKFQSPCLLCVYALSARLIDVSVCSLSAIVLSAAPHQYIFPTAFSDRIDDAYQTRPEKMC